MYKKVFIKNVSSVFSLLLQLNTSYNLYNHRINYFSIHHKKKQFFFNFTNVFFNPIKTISSGLLLSKIIKKFKFFKKSIYNFNSIIFKMSLFYKNFLLMLYILENKNYTKKSYLLIKKLLDNKLINSKFFIFSKTWKYINNPKKRIKRRVLRIVKSS